MRLHLLSFLLFGVSSSMDNLVVGLSYGMKKAAINWLINALVGCISFTGTLLSMLFGKSLLIFLPQGLANLLGGLIIILIGVIGLGHFFVSGKSSPSDETAVRVLTIRQTFLLGAALTANNIGLGIGASITGLPPLPTALCSLCFSLLFLYAGNWIGRTKLPGYINQFAEPLANFLMILLGLYEIFI